MSNKLKKVILVTFSIIAFNSGLLFSQIDSAAIAILDNMNDFVTGLESCSFEIKTEYDIYSSRLGLVKHSDIAEVFMNAPDKIFVRKKGDSGQREYYCDGKTFTYYSVNSKIYAQVPSMPTIIETIDTISENYGVEFPAADIFYPDLVDELLENSDNISYLGITEIEGKECFHIAGTNDELTYQVWVMNDKNYLPAKLAIVYTNKPGTPQYSAVFRNWSINPVLQDSMFNFKVPSDAVKTVIKTVK